MLFTTRQQLNRMNKKKVLIYFNYALILAILAISMHVIDFKNVQFFCNSNERVNAFINKKNDINALLYDLKDFKIKYVRDSAFNIKKNPKLSEFYTSTYTYIPERKVGFYTQVHELDSITRALFFDRFYDYNISKIKVVDSIYSITLDYVYTCRCTYKFDYLYKNDSFSLLKINPAPKK